MEKGFTIKVLDDIGFVRYIDHMGSDERICEAARISYKAPSKGVEQDRKLINYLYRNMHSSPFEQVNITFNIKLPLFVQGQLIRHRTARVNQVSARYTEMTDEFYFPTEWRKQDDKNKQGSKNGLTKLQQKQCLNSLVTICHEAYTQYEGMLEIGAAREMARMILPQNLYTEIYWNIDLNNLMKFFRLRLDEHSQFEIREYAKGIYKIFEELFPMCSDAYKKYKFKLIENE